MDFVEGNICAPLGFQASGVLSGHKDELQSDIALVVCKGHGTAAAVYTQNQVKGHSLLWSQAVMAEEGPIHAVLVNSGNANCGLGVQGDEDTSELIHWTAQQLGHLPEEILMMSTGYIGLPLPVDTLKTNITEAVQTLNRDQDAARDAADAMLTTDTSRKVSTVTFEIQGHMITMSAMAKGSSMVQPNMATLLAVITCDADVDGDFLQDSLTKAVEKTFNRVTIDGETSPCDMVTAICSGLANNPRLQLKDPSSDPSDLKTFTMAMEGLLMRLARLIASDGLGATKLIDVRVEGAETEQDAYEVALNVAQSTLFKTAMFAEQPNWGRIMAAVGNASAVVDPNRLSIQVGPLSVCQHGVMVPYDLDLADRILSNPEIIVTIHLDRGAYTDHYWTCDYSYDSIKFSTQFQA